MYVCHFFQGKNKIPLKLKLETPRNDRPITVQHFISFMCVFEAAAKTAGAMGLCLTSVLSCCEDLCSAASFISCYYLYSNIENKKFSNTHINRKENEKWMKREKKNKRRGGDGTWPCWRHRRSGSMRKLNSQLQFSCCLYDRCC